MDSRRINRLEKLLSTELAERAPTNPWTREERIQALTRIYAGHPQAIGYAGDPRDHAALWDYARDFAEKRLADFEATGVVRPL